MSRRREPRPIALLVNEAGDGPAHAVLLMRSSRSCSNVVHAILVDRDAAEDQMLMPLCPPFKLEMN